MAHSIVAHYSQVTAVQAKPQVLFYRCSEAKKLSGMLDASWETKTPRSLKELESYSGRREGVAIVSDWKPDSAFAKWSEKNAQMSIFVVLDKKHMELPEHVTDWIRLPMGAAEFRTRLINRHGRWQQAVSQEEQISKLKKDRILQVQMTDRLLKVSMELKRAKEEVEKLSLTDPLTKLSNRRYFDGQLARDIMQSNRYLTPLSMYFIDLDDFKHVNDTYGHPVGDEVLTKLGQLVQHNLRETDWAARYGGEEFCIILPMQGLTGALSSAGRMLKLIENNIEMPDGHRVTASFGVSAYNPEVMKRDDLIRYSDQALYHSKRTGKNKVTYFNDKTNSYEEHT